MAIYFVWKISFTSVVWVCVWERKRAIALLKLAHVDDVEVQYCGCGMAWKNPTRLRYFPVPGAREFIERLCHSELCTCVCLTGTDVHGVFMTLRACAYPWALCDRLSAALLSAARLKLLAERADGLKAGVDLRNASVLRR